MDARLLEFIGELRRAELRISPSEAVDALLAAAEVGLDDRETFRAALAATLVKSARDQETFDRLFDLYFLDLRALDRGLRTALGPDDPGVQALLASLLDGDGPELDPLTAVLLTGEAPALEAAVRAEARRVGLERLAHALQLGVYARRVADGLDLAAVERDLAALLRWLEARGLDPGQLARVRSYLELRLEGLRRLIRRHLEREVERRAWRRGERLVAERLADTPLFALTADQVTEMKAVVARLARRIRDALALRQRRARRGRIDTRRTTRRSLAWGGVPMELVLRRRRRDRPKLVTICDVSDSVRNASRFMLQLVWSLQDCFSRVRSFVFVSEIAEVTEAFDAYPVERAIEWALRAASVDYHCRSDFGYAFSRFVASELDTLDRRTTVLVLGDARNNYNDPQAWALRMIRERVRGVIWLNPEGQWGWGVGDSVMPLYATACDVVRECRTVRQLAEVVDELAHRWWRPRR